MHIRQMIDRQSSFHPLESPDTIQQGLSVSADAEFPIEYIEVLKENERELHTDRLNNYSAITSFHSEYLVAPIG